MLTGQRAVVFLVMLTAYGTVSAGDLPETLQKNLDKAKSDYEDATKSAEKKLLEAFELEITLIRRQEGLKAEVKQETIEAIETERATFEKNGFIPFSPRMRAAALNHLKAIRQGERPVVTAYEKATDYLIKTKKDDAAAALLIDEKKKLIKAKPVGVWECTGISFKDTFTWTLYADGTGAGAITWTLDKEKLVITNQGTGAPKGGWIDTCVLDSKGQNFTAKNQRGGTYTGKRVDPKKE
jgi:hypothetical protein